MGKHKNKKSNKTNNSDLQEERELTPEEMAACKLCHARAEKEASNKALRFLTAHVDKNNKLCINPKEFTKKAHLGANLMKRLRKGGTFTEASYQRMALGIVMFLDKLVELRVLTKYSMPTPEARARETDKMRADFCTAFGPHATWAFSLKQQGADLEMQAMYLKQKAWHNKNQPQKRQPPENRPNKNQPNKNRPLNSEIL